MTTLATMTQLSAFLEREQTQRGWSMREAARRCGLNFSTYQYVLRHPNHTPELDTLRSLARGFQVSLGRLLELAGLDLGGPPAAPLSHLTDADRQLLEGLRPDELRAVLDFIRTQRALYQSDED